MGIQIKNGWVNYKNKHVPISKIDRKTRGTDFYDGKRFIKPITLIELSKKIEKSYSLTIKFDWTNTKYDKTYENKITRFVSRVVNDAVLEDKARLTATEYAKSRSIP